MSTPLFDKINSIKTYPLHMPGHKRKFDKFDLLSLDITEIKGTDNLHKPQGVIKEAQQLMAQAVGADRTLFCVNGGSSGILTAILGCCTPNDRLLTVKNVHKSIYNGIILSGCKSALVSPEITPYGVCGGVTVNKLESALKQYSDIKAVLLVSPTYEGFVSDISKIAGLVHKYNKILIVDETHGSHFPFHKEFPKSAVQLGADISVNSWHKTLPALGQSAIINIKEGRVDFEKIAMAHSMVNTTSPSYMLMGVMDYVRGYLQENKNYLDKYVYELLKLQERLDKLNTFENARSLKGGFGIYDYDISKLTLFINNALSNTLEDRLIENGFQPELIDNIHIIAMTSIADDMNSINQFVDFMYSLDNGKYINKKQKYISDNKILTSDFRKYFYMEKTEISIDKAEGRICADFITPYPPDIPVLIPGQRITRNDIEYIKNCSSAVLGLNNNKIKIIGEK